MGKCLVTRPLVGMTVLGDHPIHKDKWQYSVVVKYEETSGKGGKEARIVQFPNGLVALTVNIAREVYGAMIDSINEAAASRVREPQYTRKLGTRWRLGYASGSH